jgi:hypothetical protein
LLSQVGAVRQFAHFGEESGWMADGGTMGRMTETERSAD